MTDKTQRRRQGTIMARNETLKEMIRKTEKLLELEDMGAKTTPLTQEEEEENNKKKQEVAQRMENNMRNIKYREVQHFDNLDEIGNMLNERTNQCFPDVTLQKTEQRENESTRVCNHCACLSCGCCCNCSRKTWCNIC